MFEDGDAAGKQALPEQAPRERDSGPRSDAAVIKSQVGVLATYNFPPPLSDAELQLWADEIKAMLITLKERSAALDEREAGINDQRDTLFTHAKVLKKMMHVFPSDTADDVAARVLRVEHQLYPRAVDHLCAAIAAGREVERMKEVRLQEPPEPTGEVR